MYPCPCCGYKTFEEKDAWLICPICFWEDDNVQSDDPDYDGRANKVSLRQAQRNFMNFGASNAAFVKDVRAPGTEDDRDVDWRPIE